LRNAVARFVRQSPAVVVAMLALFVAMGGTAIAAGNALITGKQIKNSSITGADVKNKSLTPKDFKGSVRGPRGLQGPKGDKGDKGDAGSPGAPNPNAVDSDKVDGYHANDLTRVASLDVTADLDNWTGTPAITDQVAITAPVRGFFLLTYAFNWAMDGGSSGTGFYEFPLNPKLDNVTAGGLAWQSLRFNDQAGWDIGTATVVRTLAVDPGAHNVAVTTTFGGDATHMLYVYERSLRVQFVPFGGTGLTPAAVAHSAPEQFSGASQR
jgi:hypothetical protein